MSANLWTDMQWLPRPPEDFKARVKSLAENPSEAAIHLRHLAQYHLSENQCHSLSKQLAKLKSAGSQLDGLEPLKVGLLSNATTSFLVPALTGTALRYGFDLEIIEAPFNQIAVEALNPQSTLNQARPDVVLVLLDARGLPQVSAIGHAQDSEAALNQALGELKAICDSIEQHAGARCIVQTIPRPPETILGSLDFRLSGTSRQFIDSYNRELDVLFKESTHVLLDTAGLAETVGLGAWHDPVYWNLAKLPFAQPLIPLFADHVCRIFAALRGRSRRCLILDLDNTLWGGAVGDIGVDGIELGQGSATGEAHLDVQRMALQLRDLGVVLAVCSKNDPDVARQPFERHPEMLLKLSDIAVFRANWTDKASNIQDIAETLDLGLQSMVFLDDNPAERGYVRGALPDVAVPELPLDPALFSRTLAAAGYFESVALTNEDRARADAYTGNARRVEIQRQAPDIDSYLRDLEMTISFAPFQEIDRARLVQLINKTNQFNLTTKRYSDTEVRNIFDDPELCTLQVRLRDRFGDNGLISIVICRKIGSTWDIDTWLMSCRVLGRKVEEAILQELIGQARDDGANILKGHYIPTKRNGLVQQHYEKLGFVKVGETSDGATEWTFDVSEASAQALPFTIERVPPAGADTGSIRQLSH